MGVHGLIKMNNKIQRLDTLNDLQILNTYRTTKGLNPLTPIKQCVRQLENAVALGIENFTDLPKLTRSESFYKSILLEITEKERQKFNKLNNGKGQ